MATSRFTLSFRSNQLNGLKIRQNNILLTGSQNGIGLSGSRALTLDSVPKGSKKQIEEAPDTTANILELPGSAYEQTIHATLQITVSVEMGTS